MRQDELAKAIGVSRYKLWRAESGRGSLRAEELVACARALGVPVWHLYLVVEDAA